MKRKEFIIHKVTKEEFYILKENSILYYPYDVSTAIIYSKDEYLKAVNLLGRY